MTKQSITLVANIALMLTVFVGSSVLAQINTPNPLAGRIPDGVENPLGPIYVFQMDGSVKDDVENITATASNNVTSVEGYIGGAMHFDGTSYAEVPIAVSALDVPDMTFVAMVKLDDLPDDPDELSAVASSGYILSVGAGNSLDTDMILSNQKEGSANIYVRSASAYVGDSKLFATPQGIWHMVAMTRKIEDRTTDDGEKTPHTILNLYINGRIKESVKEYKGKAVEPKIFFGAYSAGSGSKFRGSIDQVAFYDRALSKDELDEMRGRLRQSSRRALQPFEPRVADRRGNSDNSIPDVAPAGVVPRQSPNSVDPREAQFPGDQFDRDQPLFPGDQFDAENGGEQEFPGDQFESGNIDSRDARLRPGEREPLDTSSMITGDRLNQLAANNLANEARRKAAVQKGLDEREGRRVSTPPTIDSSSQPADGFVAPDLSYDSRDEIDPSAAVASVVLDDSMVNMPIETAEDFEDLMDTPEGRSLVQTVDWEFVGLVPGSINKQTLFPGDQFTARIRVTKNDPANKLPKVLLSVEKNGDSPIYIRTTEDDPVKSRDFPVTLTVPDKIQFASGSDEKRHGFVARILLLDGKMLVDAVRRNHTGSINVTVTRKEKVVVDDDPQDDVANSADDTTGPFTYPYISIHTGISGSEGDKVEEYFFYEDQDVVTGFRIQEKLDRPCAYIVYASDAGSNPRGCSQLSPFAPSFSGRPGDPIAALQVCHSYQNDRVKGLRVWRRSFDSSGNISPANYELSNAEKTFDLPNCSRWRERVMCHSSAVATGARVHLNGNGTVVGLQLMCTGVVPN